MGKVGTGVGGGEVGTGVGVRDGEGGYRSGGGGGGYRSGGWGMGEVAAGVKGEVYSGPPIEGSTVSVKNLKTSYSVNTGCDMVLAATIPHPLCKAPSTLKMPHTGLPHY